MRQSFTEYITAVGRWWLLVIADLLFSGISAYLDVTGDGPVPLGVWLTALVGGLSIAPFIAFNKVRTERDEKRREVRELEESRPSIQVEVINDRLSRMLLEVTNLGEHGDFEAQIEMLEGRECIHGMERPTLPTYAGCWELGLGPKASLAQGHSDRLMIGKMEMHPRLWNAEFYMYFYDARAGQAKHFGTISWSPGGGAGMPARFVLRITISSTPRMKQGPFVKTYVVDGEADPHLQEGGA